MDIIGSFDHKTIILIYSPADLSPHLFILHHTSKWLSHSFTPVVFFFFFCSPVLSVKNSELLATTSKLNSYREAASSFFRDRSHQIIAAGAVNSTRGPLWDPPSVNFYCLKSVGLCACVRVHLCVLKETCHEEIKGRSARPPDHFKGRC